MKNCNFIIIWLWSVAWLVSCVPSKRKSETIQKFTKTGDAIAVDELIHKYEREHQKLYNEETKDGALLQWPELDNKKLSNYCRKYLHQFVPNKRTDVVTGTQIERKVHYVKENTSKTSKVVIVQCKIMYIAKPQSFYLTRALEPNCVYALQCTQTGKRYILTIIHKRCDFEDEPDKPSKWMKEEIVREMHPHTRQPIAKDEYLLKYEMEHQELYKRESEIGKHIDWPRARADQYLDAYCYQYMKQCIPNGKREGITGTWKTEMLHYEKLKVLRNVKVTTITCLGFTASNRHYHITKAPELNCVYALIRRGHGTSRPFIIIFKHCDFEDVNNQKDILPDYENLDKNITSKPELLQETFDTLK